MKLSNKKEVMRKKTINDGSLMLTGLFLCTYHCCKSDVRSQWGMVIFAHLGLRNPWTDSLEIWHMWLRQQSHNTCKIWWPPKMGGGLGIWVTLHPRVLFNFFWFLQCVHSLPWEAWIFAQCIQQRVSVVGVFLWGRFTSSSNTSANSVVE